MIQAEIQPLLAHTSPWRAAYWRVLPDTLEAAYEAATSREHDRRNQFGIVLGLACLIVGLATDHTVGPEVFQVAVIVKSIHFVVAIGAVCALSLSSSAAIRELAVLAASVSAVGVQVLISAKVPGELALIYLLMAGFYALCINFVCVFRVAAAIRNAAAVTLTYIGGVYALVDPVLLTGSPIGGIVLLFAVAAFLTAIVPIQGERSRRKVFLSEARVAEANARLEKLLRTDALTGVFNRRAFDEELATSVQRAQATSKSVGLLLLDVDHFKIYNDKLGHQAGDVCLQKVAQCLAANVRAGDTVCRYGGEEFVVVLMEGVTRESAGLAGERLRAAVERMALPHPREDGAVVTISVGAVAVLSGQVCSGADLIGLADAALYTSKRSGRNRVTVLDGGMGPDRSSGRNPQPTAATAA